MGENEDKSLWSNLTGGCDEKNMYYIINYVEIILSVSK